MKRILVALFCLAAISGCASRSGVPHNLDAETTVPVSSDPGKVTADNARAVLEHYSVTFSVPNVLFGQGQAIRRRYDPAHRETILCTATLLDTYATEADILRKCSADSTVAEDDAGDDDRDQRRPGGEWKPRRELVTDPVACAAEYRERFVRDGMFRIRLSMESGFSDKSMDPDHWAMYIVTKEGVMVEPDDIVATKIVTRSASAGSTRFPPRPGFDMYRRDLHLYFKRVTFFGEDLFAPDNPYILFVMSHEQDTVARVAWIRSPEGVLAQDMKEDDSSGD